MMLRFLSIHTTASTQKKYQGIAVLLCTQLPVLYITSAKTGSYYKASCWTAYKISCHFGTRNIAGRLTRTPLTICHSVQENAFLNLFATDRTLRHAISTHLACTMSTEEDHVLQTVQTNRTHCLLLDVLQLLL
jgi:hypothetical protein